MTAHIQNDDLEAVRQIASALEPFKAPERERIIRWVREKLGMTASSASAAPPIGPLVTGAAGANDMGSHVEFNAGTDIKTFVTSKNPTSASHLVATVAYFHRFVAPETSRKESIDKDDVLDACRQAQVTRPKAVAQVLVNALAAGFVDRAEKGRYKLNAVGENLVAMVLPEKPPRSNSSATKSKRGKRAPKTNAKKSSGKRAARKA